MAPRAWYKLGPVKLNRMVVHMQAFQDGQLVQPLSLCMFADRDRPAMLRMLGSTLIAATDDVAAEVANRCALESFDLTKLFEPGLRSGAYKQCRQCYP
jgi:hypothetical protein